MIAFWGIYLVIGWGFGLASLVHMLDPDVQQLVFDDLPLAERLLIMVAGLGLAVLVWPMYLIDRYCDNGDWRG